MKDINHDLKKHLQRLELSARKIVETRGYTKEVEKIRLLGELIKEQLTDENSGHSTRQTR